MARIAWVSHRWDIARWRDRYLFTWAADSLQYHDDTDFQETKDALIARIPSRDREFWPRYKAWWVRMRHESVLAELFENWAKAKAQLERGG